MKKGLQLTMGLLCLVAILYAGTACTQEKQPQQPEATSAQSSASQETSQESSQASQSEDKALTEQEQSDLKQKLIDEINGLKEEE